MLNAELYEVPPDPNTILGPVSDVPQRVLANGLSGRGMQHAAALGRASSADPAISDVRTLPLLPYHLLRSLKDMAGCPSVPHSWRPL